MPVVPIKGVDVAFPFDPYQVQLNYMERVIDCLQKKTNAVLESPTGTGKTLSLLCSSLAWLMQNKACQNVANSLPSSEAEPMSKVMNLLNPAAGPAASWSSKIKIIYTSRTHSQLSQAMAELKQTDYANIKVTVLGSRDQLCVHPAVVKEQNSVTKNLMCRTFVADRSCRYYNNVETTKTDPALQTVIDIEDLVKNGRKLSSCPYYLARDLQKDADIIFAPYSYLLDPKIRQNQDINLVDSVVIFDEGHNIEKISEEVMSSKLSSTNVAHCIEEVTEVMKVRQNQDETTLDEIKNELSMDDLCLLKTVLLKLEEVIDEYQLETEKNTLGLPFKALPGSEVFPILAKAQITNETYPPLLEILDKVSLFAATKSGTPFARKGEHFAIFQEFIKGVFQSSNSSRSCFKLYVEPDKPSKSKFEGGWGSNTNVNTTSGKAKIFNYWCFNPSFGLRSLLDMGVRSVILTSGTLSPMDATISELGIPIGVQLENPHIIQSHQVFISIVGKGPGNVELRSTYNNRDNRQYISELGQTILNCIRIVPHGVLVFFPSYSVMNKSIEVWQESGMWSNLSKHKQLFIEQTNKLAAVTVIEEFYKAVDEKGAVLFAVCRGKVSEGLDFSDNRARAVLITGIPYPPIYDPRIVLKKDYLNENCQRNKISLNGQRWYQLEAIRAVNQALGRVLRHSQDYGALILCDSRFSSSCISDLSSWLRPLIFKAPTFGAFMQKLVGFFRGNVNLPKQKPTLSIECSSNIRAITKKLPSIKTDSSENNEIFLNGYSCSFPSTSQEPSKKPLGVLDAIDMASNEDFEEPERALPNDMAKLPIKRKSPSNEPDSKKSKLTLKSSDIEAIRRIKNTKQEDNSEQHIKQYLCKVKALIPQKAYDEFKVMVLQYSQTNLSFQEVMTSLKKIFPVEKKELQCLFKGFHVFLSAKEKENFFDECRILFLKK